MAPIPKKQTPKKTQKRTEAVPPPGSEPGGVERVDEFGCEPTTTRHFTESSPDGFASETPEWVAFCPECGMKLSALEHAECPYYRGADCSEPGGASAIECAFAGKPRRRARAKSRTPR